MLTAPFSPTEDFLNSLPYGLPAAVYHGPTAFMPDALDPYADARKLNIFVQMPNHDYMNVNAGTIVDRIVKSRGMYEERQRLKGVKANVEVTMNHES